MPEFTAKDVQRLRQESGAGMMDAKRALTENSGDFEAASKWLRERGVVKATEKASRANEQGAVTTARSGNAVALVELKSETDYVAKSPDFTGFLDHLAEAVATSGEDAVAAHQESLDDLRLKLKENISVGRVVCFEAAEGAVIDSYVHIQNDRGVNGVVVEIVDGDEALAHDIALHVSFARPEFLAREDVPSERLEAERATLEAITRNEGKPEKAIPKIVEGRLGGWYKEHVLLDQAWVKDGKQTISGLVGSARLTRFAQVEIGR